MSTLKGLLFGTAVGVIAVANAQAADMPVKAKPVQYVKICSLYGDGFYYVPGTNTCFKFGGYMRVQLETNMGAGGTAVGNGGTMSGQARFARDVTNDINYRVRSVMSVDVRDQTDWGVLRSYFRIGIQQTTPTDGTAGNVYWDRAFIQFAGFTVGRTISMFDLFNITAYSYHDVRVTGDTTQSNGVALWAYTADFGNGFSASVSLEDPNNSHARAPVVDATVPGFFAVNGVIVNDTGLAFQSGTNNGFRMPDTVFNLRVDQAWGFAGISTVIHEVGAGYYGTPNAVANGHPADKYGWAISAGGKVNLSGGDIIGLNVCYAQGAPGYCTRQGTGQLYDSSTSVAAGWITDAVFTTGTELALTRAWSVQAAYEHIWNPRWKTSVFGGYMRVDYDGSATAILNSALVAGSVCARPFAGLVGNLSAIRADAGNSCNPDYGFFEVGTRTVFNPSPLLDIGVEILYSHHLTAYKGAALYTANAPRPAVPLLDDGGIWSGMFRWQRNFYP